MSRQMLNAKELAELLGVSDSKSYQYIRQMNAELAANGFLTVRGRVPRAYVEKRFYGCLTEPQQEVSSNA